MMEQVALLLKAIKDIEDANDGADNHHWGIASIIDEVVDKYDALESARKQPIQWNKTEPPQDARNCNDHPAVRNTDYMEVHHLTGTSGCSPAHPHWTWPVLGVIQTESGKQLVVPGDWICEPVPGKYIVIHNDQYEALFGEQPNLMEVVEEPSFIRSTLVG